MRCRPHLAALLAPLALALAACSSKPDIPFVDAGAGGAATDAGSTIDGPIPAEYQAFAAAFDAEREALGAPGAAVALLRHGKLAFAHGFGTKGPASADPVSAHTLFRIGSMTKALTAVALLRVAREKGTDLDAALGSVAPDVSLKGPELAELTLKRLLSQQSGLYDYSKLYGSTDDATLSVFLTGSTFGAGAYFMAPPGAFWNYSNPNFALAGLALERLEGATWRSALSARVLAPLGMARTFALPAEVEADGDFTNGLSANADGSPWDVAPSSYDVAWFRPAGLAFSSVLDFARFVAFVRGGDPKVLGPADHEAFTSAQVSTLYEGDVQGYGYGLFVAKGFHVGEGYYATKLVYHGGDVPGFAADFYLLPESGAGIVTLANADGAHFQSSLALALSTFGELPAPSAAPAGVDPDPALFPSYAGEYLDAHNVGSVTVTATSGGVSVSMPALDAAGVPYDPALVPVSRDSFVLGVQGLEVLLTFVRGPTGSYDWIRTRFFVAGRAPGDAGAPAAWPGFDAPSFLAKIRAAERVPRLRFER